MKVAVMFFALTMMSASGEADENVCVHYDKVSEGDVLSEIERLQKKSSVSSKLLLASCYSKIDEFDKALSTYASLESQYGKSAELSKAMGIALYRKNDYENALKKLIDAIQDDYKDPEVIMYVGLSFYKKGELLHGMEALKSGIDLLEKDHSSANASSYSPVSEDLHFYLSQMHLDQGDEKSAAKVLKDGLELYPGSRRLFDEVMELSMREKVGLSDDEVKRYCSEILIQSSKFCSSVSSVSE